MRSSNILSTRQENILNYIQNFIQENGYSPSIRDIQLNLNISSTSVVAYNLKALQEKGKLDREGKISRGIRLVDTNTDNTLTASQAYQVPLLGTITAGEPLPNPEDTSDSNREMVDVPAEMVPHNKLKDIYALRIRGHSMIDALIDDGDIVLIRYQETADNGDMVAVRLAEENAVTLKKFYHEGDKIRLQPANNTLEPRFVTPNNVRIHGRVVGVLRPMM